MSEVLIEYETSRGSAEPSAGASDESDLSQFAGVLLLPDVEYQHGWRSYWVKRQQQKPGNDRPMGFRH